MILKLVTHPGPTDDENGILKKEQYIEMGVQYSVDYISVPDRMGAHAGNTQIPSDCIAIVKYGSSCEVLYITETQEAYLIGEAGQTVSVISKGLK